MADKFFAVTLIEYTTKKIKAKDWQHAKDIVDDTDWNALEAIGPTQTSGETKVDDW